MSNEDMLNRKQTTVGRIRAILWGAGEFTINKQTAKKLRVSQYVLRSLCNSLVRDDASGRVLGVRGKFEKLIQLVLAASASDLPLANTQVTRVVRREKKWTTRKERHLIALPPHVGLLALTT